MSNKKEVVYAVPDTRFPRKEGETLPYRSTLLAPDEPLWGEIDVKNDTLKKQFINSVEQFRDEPFLGTRKITDYDEEGKPIFGNYEFITYHEVYMKSLNLAKSIKALHLYSEPKDNKKTHPLIGIYAKNCEGWAITDIACLLTGVGSVTLYDTLGGDSSEYIIKQTELITIFCTADHVEDLIKIRNKGNVDHLDTIVVMNHFTQEDAQAWSKAGFNIYSMEHLIEQGEKENIALDDPEKEEIYTICYTSGTTGDPKGVKLSHENLVAIIEMLDKSPIKIISLDTHLSYLPLAHILERIVFCCLMTKGARVGFYQGDVLKLKDDLVALRPTLFVSVPRLYSKLYDKIQAGIAEAKGWKKSLVTKAVKTKLANYEKNGSVKHCLWDRLVFKKMKAALGGRVRYWITGSAPISKDVLNFLKIAFCCPIMEGYGQTELTGATSVTFPDDSETGHVGGVTPCYLMKLQDVPEMNYFSTDEKDGVNYPRGEVCYKGKAAFSGYFKEPEKTAETIDKDGWVHTGDIGEIQPNGALRIIDRKKNIFKLSQGEYIAAEKLELIYAKSPLIAQIFVYGDSLQPHLVAIIVPDKEEVEKLEESKDYEAYISSKDFHNKIFDWFKEAKGIEKLTSLEVPKAIHWTSDEFKIEDGTLTPTFKLVRAEAKKKFLKEIRQLYGGAKLQGE